MTGGARTCRERLAATLLPPACREHVLGDLAESSDSPGEYVRNLASVLPGVVWCQIRRRSSPLQVIANALLLAAFLPALVGSMAPGFLSGAWGAYSLAAVSVVWAIGCVLADAYGPEGPPRHASGKVFVAAILATLGTAALMEMPVVPVGIAMAVVTGIWILFAVIWVIPRQGAAPALSPDTVAARAEAFWKGIRRRNVVESLACAFIMTYSAVDLVAAPSTVERLSHATLLAGVLFVLLFLNLRATAHRPPVGSDVGEQLRFYRAELRRHGALLRSVPVWYLLPLVPGIVLRVLSGWDSAWDSLALVLFAMVGAAIVWLNRRGARWLDAQAEEADQLERQLS